MDDSPAVLLAMQTYSPSSVTLKSLIVSEWIPVCGLFEIKYLENIKIK